MSTKKPSQNKTQLNPTFSVPDLDTRFVAAYNNLTPKQRAGIDAIIAAELDGKTIDGLIEVGVFAHSTYYGRDGWRHQHKFQEALSLARVRHRDARQAAAIAEARDTIASAAPEAARVMSAKLKVKAEALRAAEDVLKIAGVGVADDVASDRVTVVITDASWKPN